MKLEDWHHRVIIRMKYLKLTWKDIAYVVNHPIGTCRDFYRLWKKNHSLPPKTIVSHRKLDGSPGLQIKKMFMEDPSLTLRQIQSSVEVNVSHETIRHFLMENNYFVAKAIRKIKISDTNIQRRKQIADFLYFKDVEFYKTILWSDEVCFKMHPKNRSITFWTRETDPYDQELITRNEPMGGISASFWGCFSFYAYGPLVHYEGSIKKENYVEMMEEYLLPELDASDVSLVFMQDGARPHTCPYSMSFFEANNVQIYPYHPAQSPDLNPIEWIWGYLKQQLPYQKPFPKNKNELVHTIMTMWENLTNEYRHKLVASMPNRIRELHAREGHWTKN